MNITSISSPEIQSNRQPIQKRTSLFEKVYRAWFKANQTLVEALRTRNCITLSALLGMLNLEAHTLIRALWLRLVKYRKAPEAYGFNPAHMTKPPILLFHGAVGEWNYLGDLAKELSQTHSVHVLNINPNLTDDEQYALISNKLLSIKALYPSADTIAVKIDLVAHSMGGSIAFRTLFRATETAKPLIGKLITIALPLDSTEIRLSRAIAKENAIYSILARYDALMGYKRSGIVLSEHCKELEAGHVGIVYHPDLGKTVESMLNSETPEPISIKF